MTEFLLAAAAFVLGTVVLGLVRILRGPGDTDRLLAVELLGTGGIAALLLIGVATGEPGIASLALLIALLAAFATVGFVTGAVPRDTAEPEPLSEGAAQDAEVENRR